MIEHFTNKVLEPLILSLNNKLSKEQFINELNNYLEKDNPEWLKNLINQLPNIKPLQLKKIYDHPVGFMKFTLFENESGSIRLHYWPNGRQKFRPDLHDHRWPFVSIPLTGSFVEEIFDRVDGENLVYVKCYPLQKSGKRDFKAISKGSLRYKETVERPTLIPFASNGKTVHRLLPQDNTPTISLVFRGPQYRNYAEVWLPEDHEHPLIKEEEVWY